MCGDRPAAHVCLVLEGTYPYLSGGVSTWVHQVITALHDIRFSLFYIGAERRPGLRSKYPIPDNVVAVTEAFLFEGLSRGELSPRRTPVAVRRVFYAALAGLLATGPAQARAQRLMELGGLIGRNQGSFTCANLWHDREAWKIACDAYGRHLPGESFLQFYWNARFLVQPLWKLIGSCGNMPRARLYHSLCTGYAGFAAALAARSTGGAYLLSEHGIYVKERYAELQNAPWIYDAPALRPDLFGGPGPLRALWIELFRVLAAASYSRADRITALFRDNAALQLRFGADADKTEVIPNGIDLSEFDEQLARLGSALPGRTVAFLGRIVKIKDIKTLLRAAGLVIGRMPGVCFLLAGETDDDPEYYRECVDLAASLGIGSGVRFTGPLDRSALLARSQVLVLTSISEGLPFVILEAFAARIPVVASDTGACRELIEGGPAESPRIGPAGFAIAQGDPDAAAAAIIALLENDAMRREYGENGRRRVEASYRLETVIGRYRELYTGLEPKDGSNGSNRSSGSIG